MIRMSEKHLFSIKSTKKKEMEENKKEGKDYTRIPKNTLDSIFSVYIS